MFVTAAKATGARTNFVVCAENVPQITWNLLTWRIAITLLLFNEKMFCSAEQFYLFARKKIIVNTCIHASDMLQKLELRRRKESFSEHFSICKQHKTIISSWEEMLAALCILIFNELNKSYTKKSYIILFLRVIRRKYLNFWYYVKERDYDIWAACRTAFSLANAGLKCSPPLSSKFLLCT